MPAKPWRRFAPLGGGITHRLKTGFLHSAAHERNTCTRAELLQTHFLASGLHVSPKTWLIAAEYTGNAFIISDSHPPIAPSERGVAAAAEASELNRWTFAIGIEFKGRPLASGQLVYYRVVSPDKAQAAAVAGTLAGWGIEVGLKYCNITKVV